MWFVYFNEHNLLRIHLRLYVSSSQHQPSLVECTSFAACFIWLATASLSTTAGLFANGRLVMSSSVSANRAHFVRFGDTVAGAIKTRCALNAYFCVYYAIFCRSIRFSNRFTAVVVVVVRGVGVVVVVAAAVVVAVVVVGRPQHISLLEMYISRKAMHLMSMLDLTLVRRQVLYTAGRVVHIKAQRSLACGVARGVSIVLTLPTFR